MATSPQPTERTIAGTSITESSMAKMLRHNREVTGGAAAPREVDHNRVAESLLSSQPVLLPSIASPRPAPRVSARRVNEGVQGTSPTPGQDNIDYVPPTTSDVTNGGGSGKKPVTKEEQMAADLGTLFGESDNPFAKGDKDKGDMDKDEKDPDGEETDDEDEDKDKDGKEKTDDDNEGVEEAVEVHCENCGYEETYDLSEAAIAEGTVPLTAEGKLDDKCPMCGANMDMSMIGATDVGQVSNPEPFTDARGNSPQQRESVVPLEALSYANTLMGRVLRGESVELVAQSVVESDFIARKKNRQPAMAGAC